MAERLSQGVKVFWVLKVPPPRRPYLYQKNIMFIIKEYNHLVVVKCIIYLWLCYIHTLLLFKIKYFILNSAHHRDHRLLCTWCSIIALVQIIFSIYHHNIVTQRVHLDNLTGTPHRCDLLTRFCVLAERYVYTRTWEQHPNPPTTSLYMVSQDDTIIVYTIEHIN